MQDTLPGLVQTTRSLSAQTGSLCRASAAFTTSETCLRATTITPGRLHENTDCM